MLGPLDAASATWLELALREAWIDLTPLLVIAFVAAVAVRRTVAPEDRRPMHGTAVLLGLHVSSLPLLGALAGYDLEAYRNVRLVSIALASLAGINIALALVFDGFLRWLRVETPRILSDLIAAGAYLIACFALLSTRGVNLSGLIATSAVLTAVIGFSLQDTLGNLMGGLALQMDKSIQPGEWIEFGDKTGRITEMRWRQTSIETRDWETIVIPNSLLAKSQITVLGRRQLAPVQLRRKLTFHVDFRYPPSRVTELLGRAISAAPIAGVAAAPQPDCILAETADSYNVYEARYWLTDFARLELIDSVVRTRTYFALKRAGIPLSIPAQAVFVTSETRERADHKAATRLEEQRMALRAVDLFDALDEEDIDELAGSLRFAPFAPGETLTREGEAGSELFLVTSGKVGIRVQVDGAEHEVATLEAGSFFGERSLVTGEPRSATTVALTDVVCYLLAKQALAAILERRPELAESVAETLARRELELDEVRRDADEYASKHLIQKEKSKILGKIRGFFGL